jgi:hypothetical protein
MGLKRRVLRSILAVGATTFISFLAEDLSYPVYTIYAFLFERNGACDGARELLSGGPSKYGLA